jgi:hypothetical protein
MGMIRSEQLAARRELLTLDSIPTTFDAAHREMDAHYLADGERFELSCIFSDARG